MSANKSATLCLYGPPGAGKTAFVRWAAERAGRRLVEKRMSDLLSCWVGETEKGIAATFQEARDEDAVLLLDEADGLLRSREGAEHSWELTQTNELLVQMESFDGVFACATNLVDALDPAAFRRFDLKVRFEPLTRAQRRGLWRDLVGAGDDEVDVVDEVTLARLDRLDRLCPGHFAAVARRRALVGPADDVIAWLIAALEEEHRFIAGGARVGFVA
jgi:SpoVK/Ycf46/Vps4 family AAA+-type ATPase